MSYFSNFKTIDYDLNGDGVSDTIINLTNIVAVSKNIIDNSGFYSYIDVLDGERPEQFSYRLYESTSYYWSFLLTNPNIKNIWNDWPMSSAQLQEYCESKYEGMAGLCDNWVGGENVLIDKFKVGDVVSGVLSGATATIKEIYVNNGYVVLDNIEGEFNSSGEDLRRDADPSNGITLASISTTAIVKNAYAPKYFIDDATAERTTKKSSGASPYTHYNWEVEVNDNNRNIKVIKPEKIESVVEEFIREISK